jgi:hypothetical protein
MELTKQQYQDLQGALLSAYNRSSLKMMLRLELNKKLDHIVMGQNLKETVFELISAAEMEGWTDQLVSAAYDANPGNPKVKAFAQQFLALRTKPVLEKIVEERSIFLDISQWREQLWQIEGQVCSIRIQNSHVGTGFLIGPDVAITNYHVMDTVINAKMGHKPQHVTLRFDYKQSTDGKDTNPGKDYRLLLADEKKWLIDCSPYSPIDLEETPKSGVPDEDHLDYALLRVDGQPGNEENRGTSAAIRGWIDIPAGTHNFPPDTPLFIVQHPQGAPLKLAVDTVIGLNPNSTRVTYRTSTEPGSSGSPCFNANLELVALHHSGDPASILPKYNEGIPISAIRTHLEKQNLSDVVG